MVKIVLPLGVRVFRAVDKHVSFFRRVHRDHADVRAFTRTINHLNITAMYVHAFNGFTGKRGARRADIEDQPLTVRRPGSGISKLMMARRKGDLFHDGVPVERYRLFLPRGGANP